ncbi:acyltransferase family protein [Kitasatospora sp. LaBMicrA B282]|uniref:acyltransferase family protein n=1 Tax=Kitasatospora sp. LaBMicrA B282 TaxID=3420949 RepID=UPI003D09E75F
MAELFTGRNNSLGLLRLVMAGSVIFSHAGVLGFGSVSLLNRSFHGQTNVGNLAVYGFFVLSGILVTRSGARLGIGRFLWHRALRLLPGLWTCLLVTGLVIVPLAYYRLHGGSLAGFWQHPDSPFEYLRNNLFAGEYQTEVAGVMHQGAQKGLIYDPELNGSLWSLKYEMLCYFAVALLGWSGVLQRARRTIVVVTAALAVPVLGDALPTRFLDPRSVPRPSVLIPHMGSVNLSYLLYLAIAFAMGALIELYRDRIPVNDLLGVLCGVTVVATLLEGYFFVIGLPAFAYLLLWLAIRLPGPLRRIGAKNDYSYGLYIYGFPVEQLLAAFHAGHLGRLGFSALAFALTLLLAAASWHLVERPALRLKDIGRRSGPGRSGSTPPRRTEAPTAELQHS